MKIRVKRTPELIEMLKTSKNCDEFVATYRTKNPSDLCTLTSLFSVWNNKKTRIRKFEEKVAQDLKNKVAQSSLLRTQPQGKSVDLETLVTTLIHRADELVQLQKEMVTGQNTMAQALGNLTAVSLKQFKLFEEKMQEAKKPGSS